MLDALAMRHVYSTLDRNCKLTFNLDGATMGDVIEEPAEQVKFRVMVEDADNGDVTATIELFEDGKVVQTYEPNKQATCWLGGCTPATGKRDWKALTNRRWESKANQVS